MADWHEIKYICDFVQNLEINSEYKILKQLTQIGLFFKAYDHVLRI